MKFSDYLKTEEGRMASARARLDQDFTQLKFEQEKSVNSLMDKLIKSEAMSKKKHGDFEPYWSEYNLPKDFNVTHNNNSNPEPIQNPYTNVTCRRIGTPTRFIDDPTELPSRPLETRRQEGKVMMGPAVLMEIFGHQLQIGKEKGYTNESWRDYLTNGSDLLPSLKRHLIGIEINEDDGWYTEYKADGTSCPTKANHAYALAWNAMVNAMRVYYKEKAKYEY